MTLDEFFERLPKDGWFLRDGTLIRMNVNFGGSDDRVCPHLYFTKVLKETEIELTGGWSQVWHAADGNAESPYFNPALRARLLAHCGLTELTPSAAGI